MGIALLLATIAVLQDGRSAPRPDELVNVRNVTFDRIDGSVDYQQVVALGVTAYQIKILWRLADGSVVPEPIDIEWFLANAFSYVSNGMVVNPLSAQTLVPSTPSHPARYVRTPAVATASQPIDAEVVVIGAVHASGVVFGDKAALDAIFRDDRPCATNTITGRV